MMISLHYGMTLPNNVRDVEINDVCGGRISEKSMGNLYHIHSYFPQRTPPNILCYFFEFFYTFIFKISLTVNI